MRRSILLLVLPLVIVFGCSDGDDGGDGGDVAAPDGVISTSSTVRVLSPDEIDPSSPYCATWKEIRSAGGPQTQDLPEGERAARRKAYYSTLVPLVERLLSQATDDIRPEVERALDNTRDAATTGSFESFRTEASKAGTQVLAQYALDHCAKG